MSSAARSLDQFVQVIETPTCILGMDEERICHTIFHPDVHITMEEMKLVEQGMIQISENRAFRILFDVRNQFIQFDKDARQHAATAPVTKLIIAEAVILNSLPNRLLFNFFLNFDKPTFPIKAFSNMNDAMDWLRKK